MYLWIWITYVIYWVYTAWCAHTQLIIIGAHWGVREDIPPPGKCQKSCKTGFLWTNIAKTALGLYIYIFIICISPLMIKMCIPFMLSRSFWIGCWVSFILSQIYIATPCIFLCIAAIRLYPDINHLFFISCYRVSWRVIITSTLFSLASFAKLLNSALEVPLILSYHIRKVCPKFRVM